MKNYIGIDLGTTNSTISTFDGVDTQIWKSPEQNELTPSVIYIDKRSKYIGFIHQFPPILMERR